MDRDYAIQLLEELLPLAENEQQEVALKRVIDNACELADQEQPKLLYAGQRVNCGSKQDPQKLIALCQHPLEPEYTLCKDGVIAVSRRTADLRSVLGRPVCWEE